MPDKQQIKSKHKCKAPPPHKPLRGPLGGAPCGRGPLGTKKATAKVANAKKGNQVEALQHAKKVLEAKKVLMLQAKKEDNEDAMDMRKAAAKKNRKMEFDAKLTALMGVMDQILLLQWNIMHPSQQAPPDLCVWKCKDML